MLMILYISLIYECTCRSCSSSSSSSSGGGSNNNKNSNSSSSRRKRRALKRLIYNSMPEGEDCLVIIHERDDCL